MSLDSFHALSGAERTTINNGTKFTVKSTSCAGVYSVTATTLFRDEDGVDHTAVITIPKAKLQSNLNITMSPTGDPSSFTFTFDAMPGTIGTERDVLFDLEIYGTNNQILSDKFATVIINGDSYTLTHSDVDIAANRTFAPVLAISAAGVITLKNSTSGSANLITVSTKIEGGDTGITNLENYYTPGDNIELTAPLTKFYII